MAFATGGGGGGPLPCNGSAQTRILLLKNLKWFCNIAYQEFAWTNGCFPKQSLLHWKNDLHRWTKLRISPNFAKRKTLATPEGTSHGMILFFQLLYEQNSLKLIKESRVDLNTVTSYGFAQPPNKPNLKLRWSSKKTNQTSLTIFHIHFHHGHTILSINFTY